MKFSMNDFSSKYDQICRKLRSSNWRCSVRKGVLRNFLKVTAKHLCQSLMPFLQNTCGRLLLETPDLVTFTGEILNGKLHVLCSALSVCVPVFLSFFPPACLSVFLFVCLSIYVTICLYWYERWPIDNK